MTFDGAPPPNRVIIIQFESMDAAKAWADNQEQKDLRRFGDKFATFRTYAVERERRSKFECGERQVQSAGA